MVPVSIGVFVVGFICLAWSVWHDCNEQAVVHFFPLISGIGLVIGAVSTLIFLSFHDREPMSAVTYQACLFGPLMIAWGLTWVVQYREHAFTEFGGFLNLRAAICMVALIAGVIGELILYHAYLQPIAM